MTDQPIQSTSSDSEDGLSPAASLTSIPVRRRRKGGGAPSVPARSGKPTPAATKTAPPPRRETFGKLQKPPAEPEADAAGSTAEPLPAAVPETEPPAAFEPTTLPAEGIIQLWEDLAGEDSIPALRELDTAKVAKHWPNSLLLRAMGNPRRPQVEVERIFSADHAHGKAPLSIDTMAIDWMMALAREVTHDGVPVHELDNVSAEDPAAEYGVIALPFGASPDSVDHVLCHLYRYEGPPAESSAAAESDRPSDTKHGRKTMASIFGRRQAATG